MTSERQSTSAAPLDTKEWEKKLEALQNEVSSLEISKQLDTLEVKPTDIIIMKGLWSNEEIIIFSKMAQERGMNNIIVMTPDDKSIDSMPTNEFFYLLQQIQKKREFDKDSLDYFAETGLLPMRLSETGADREEMEEAIICSSISGGARYENNMPEGLTLTRRMKDGTEYVQRYVQAEE